MLADRVRMGSIDSIDLGPGSPKLIAGTMEAGFFGEVPASELFTASELASAVGLTRGNARNESEPWLKFAYEGKILFRPRKAIRNSLSWNSINEVNCVYGGSNGFTVTKNGNQYIVRLMRGALTDPSKHTDNDKGAMGSEWNRLMLPIHEQSINKNWAYSRYVEDDIPTWPHSFGTGTNGMYSDVDLEVNNRELIWQQETTNSNASNRVIRGFVGATYSDTSGAATTSGGTRWAPVLELA